MVKCAVNPLLCVLHQSNYTDLLKVLCLLLLF